MIQILTVRKPLNISSPQFITVEYCTAGGTTSRVCGKKWGKASMQHSSSTLCLYQLLQHHPVLLGMKPVHRMIRAWHLNYQMPLTLGHLASAHFSYPCFLSVLMNLGDA